VCPGEQARLVLEFEVVGRDFAAAGNAATRIKRALEQVGFSARAVRRAAITAYEAEMNIVIHARRGTMSAYITADTVEIAAVDEGPGIPDIELAMREGFSTAPDYVREMGFGAGMGLPNMRKCADDLTVDSEVDKGTSVRAVIRNY
jgi:anti-sigma regulatory factor (Ser/Thr protein kinase)